MTNYKEEQKDEIEALEAIYPNEIKVLETDPNYVFVIEVAPQGMEETDELAMVTIQFSLDDTYPDTIPVMEITESVYLDDAKLDEILEHMNTVAQENVGMVMVFTIVSAVQEKISDIIEQTKLQREEEQLRKQKEHEEKEQRIFEGTRVTVETFLAWKTKFDAEMKDFKKNDITLSSSKLTGKELFLQDSSMIVSDMQFLQGESEAVEVDESLFQEIDDFGLDEELQD
ncbi:RWD domain-containing protein 1 [Acanthosepion pharaonis]|uniref:RWD domain-containing protein 1 n=1 Tax=Acanthosepion pharaonis TaxID=158019 RepID=A0A812EE73_ACAPH|nr:RWD domain-containing protein 1 [Sepia pharaonis]